MEYLGLICFATLLLTGLGSFIYIFILLGSLKYDYKYLVACVALTILSFTLSYLFIYSGHQTNHLNPPHMSSCPDFWNLQSDGTCQIPGSTGQNMGDIKQINVNVFTRVSDPTSYVDSDSSLPSLGDLSVKGHKNGTTFSPVNVFAPGTSINNIDMNDISNASIIVKNTYLSKDFPFGFDLINASNSNKYNVDFTDMGWSTYGSGGSSRVCALKTWANQHGIIWDGVTNYNKC